MDNYIENKIAEVEKNVYGGEMPAHNKAVLRQELKKEERFHECEELENSHSPIGDLFNAGNRE
jgi:hypothetical protein